MVELNGFRRGIFLGGSLYIALPRYSENTITTPGRSRITREKYLGRVTYSKIMLAFAVTFIMLPSFQQLSDADRRSIPALEQKKQQLSRLFLVLVRPQGEYIGSLDGSYCMGLDFLSLVANAYGVRRAFYKQGRWEKLRPPGPPHPPRKDKRFIKTTDATGP